MKTIITVEHDTKGQLTSIMSILSSQINLGVINADVVMSFPKGSEVPLPMATPPPPGYSQPSSPSSVKNDHTSTVKYELVIVD